MGLRSLSFVTAAFVVQLVSAATIFTHGTEFFCREHDCYEILGLEFGASTADVKKAYRKIAIENHPDKLPAGADVEAAKKRLNLATLANDMIGRRSSKLKYDAAFKDPKGFYANQTKWWSRNIYAPKTNPFFAVAVFIVSISYLQYYVQGTRYREAKKAFRKRPSTIAEAKRMANVPETRAKWLKEHPEDKPVEGKKKMTAAERKKAGLPPKKKKSGGKKKAKTTGATEAEIEAQLDILVANVQIEGGYAAPHWKKTCVGWMLFRAPGQLLWQLNWFFKFTLFRSAYGDAEKYYLTYFNMGISQGKFEHDYNEEERASFVARELWIPENLRLYEGEKAAARQAKRDLLNKVPESREEALKLQKLREQAIEEAKNPPLGQYDDVQASF